MSESCSEYCIVHRHAILKSRKQHTCSACSALILPGDYYASVFALGQEGSNTFKRCGACEKTWQHLKTKCDEANARKGGRDDLYPLEDLSCDLSYEEEWGDLPDEIAALPFLSGDERGAILRKSPRP
jgi:hypothetical protein